MIQCLSKTQSGCCIFAPSQLKLESAKTFCLLISATIILVLFTQPLSAVPPNIVMIMADDLGFECIGANGGTSYKTPVLDKLASEGVQVEHCYSQPICTPSRVMLMTGIYNVRNDAEFGLLEASQTTFANIFRDAGYPMNQVTTNHDVVSVPTTGSGSCVIE